MICNVYTLNMFKQTNLGKQNVNLKYDMLIILMILKSNATSFRIRLDECKEQESFKRGYVYCTFIFDAYLEYWLICNKANINRI